MEVQLYNPHPNQEKIHNSINNEGYKYYVLDIGRQFGKSLLATNQVLYWGLNEVVEIGWVSPVYNQAYKVYDQIVRAFEDNPHVFKRKDAQKLRMELCNGSTIQFYSAERYDNIRGNTFDYLVCDEFAFMKQQAWTEVLKATLLVKGKKALLISTPNGKNHFFQLHQLDGINDQYKSFTMTSYDNPMIDPKEIDDARNTLPDHIFRQEYLAEFVDGGANIFGELIINDKPEKVGRYYGGIDVARADDYTVLSVYNSKGQQVFIDRWRHDSWSNIAQKVADKINEYDAQCYIEVNGVGDPIEEMVKSKLKNKNNIQPFVTTNKTKQNIIEQLAVANQQNEVSFLPHEWLRKEFEIFTYEYNPKTRVIKYSAPPGFHDDGILGCALGYEAFKSLRLKGVYAVK